MPAAVCESMIARYSGRIQKQKVTTSERGNPKKPVTFTDVDDVGKLTEARLAISDVSAASEELRFCQVTVSDPSVTLKWT